MKKIGFLCAILCCILSTQAQTVIQSPKYACNLSGILQIDKLELKDTATIVHFTVQFTPKWWIQVDTNSYIRPTNDTTIKLHIKSTNGMAVSCNKKWTMPDSGIVHFALVYPPLPKGVSTFDFIENEKSDWKIYGIELKESISILPKSLLGNWLAKNGSNKWLLGLYDSVAIYENAIWNYGKITATAKKAVISLVKGKQTIAITIQTDSLNWATIRKNDEAPIVCTRNKTENTAFKSANTINQFGKSFFQMGEATISGVIKGYKTTATEPSVANNNMVKSYLSQGSITLQIQPNGTFECQIPLLHPKLIGVWIPTGKKNSYYTIDVYAEPGHQTTICYNQFYEGANRPKTVFMGDDAAINNELAFFNENAKVSMTKANSVISDSIEGLSLEDYKACLYRYYTQADVAILNQLSVNTISTKSAHILHAQNKMSFAYMLLRYNSNKNFYYKQKRKITDYSKTYVAPVKYGYPYLNVVKSALQDTLSVMSSQFSSLYYTIKELEESKKPEISLTAIV